MLLLTTLISSFSFEAFSTFPNNSLSNAVNGNSRVTHTTIPSIIEAKNAASVTWIYLQNEKNITIRKFNLKNRNTYNGFPANTWQFSSVSVQESQNAHVDQIHTICNPSNWTKDRHVKHSSDNSANPANESKHQEGSQYSPNILWESRENSNPNCGFLKIVVVENIRR